MITGQKIAEQEWDDLIFDPMTALDTTFVGLAKGEKILPRGSVIQKDGKLFDESGEAFYILAEETDTGETAGGTVLGLCYRMGHFNRNALTIKEGKKLTQEAEETLRTGGIYLSTSMQ